MSAENRQELRSFYLQALLEDCVPFWFPRAIDQEFGGFLHCFDRDGTLVDSDKSIWAQGRMSWMLLSLYQTVEPRAEWLKWAESGLKFLEQHGFDDDGRMYFHVARDGTPIRKRRYAFSECFASIAYAAHAKVTGEVASQNRARALFEQFFDWNFTEGKMPPKFTQHRPMFGLSPRLMTLATGQELRRHGCLMREHEAMMEQAKHEIRDWFVKPDLHCLMETVGPNGVILDHFDGRTLNPGHAIECAWMLMDEGQMMNQPEWCKLGCQILDWMWERGWDEEYGGLFYFRDVYHKPVQEYWHDMKFWWPHDEALIATLYAWRLTGEPRYQAWHELVLNWSFERFGDPQYGEWFGYLHRDGRPANTLKGSLWKSFFHHPRALWRCYGLLKDLKFGI